MNNEPVAYENTDKEIWQEIPDDYYSPSIFVTKENNIGISVGGTSYVKPAREWHKLADTAPKELTLDEIFDCLKKVDSGAIRLPNGFKFFAEELLKKAREK